MVAEHVFCTEEGCCLKFGSLKEARLETVLPASGWNVPGDSGGGGAEFGEERDLSEI